jgi:TRPM family ion channel
VSARTISFGAGRQARLLADARYRAAADLVAELGLAPPADGRPVILVCGGAVGLTGRAFDRARTVIEGEVAPVAGQTGAVVVDGGTAAGTMLLTGGARASQPDNLPVLLGVAPAGLVSYPGGPSAGEPLDSGHSHFILVPGNQWGGETLMLIEVARAVAGSGPVAVVVAGGGEVTRAEIASARAQHWPVFGIAGTGGEADSSAAVRKVGDTGACARLLGRELGRSTRSRSASGPRPGV